MWGIRVDEFRDKRISWSEQALFTAFNTVVNAPRFVSVHLSFC